ncbi:glycoside hydrolase family 18 protein [Dendrothele bispora CBS 962.96]|uniref:chitinase n=1 Tax=Dendrothele bispora (strain CBS 962.96) TaxID=1314807 RepID=A0A4S8MQ33_DENBC|nr:glycoside hydrolase family 18 protein [Dendrothele bispora CBS 962.96]
MPPSSGNYEPVPTNDSNQNLLAPEPHPEKPLSRIPKSFSKRKIAALVFAFFLVAFLSYKVGQWSVTDSTSISSSGPAESSTAESGDFEETKPEVPTSDNTSTNTTLDTMGKYSVGYFVNWGIYGRKFPPSKIPVNDLTHILYAFANVNSGSGEVSLSDLWADQDIHYPGDSWNDAGTNLYGNFKAIYNLKKQNRHLKLLLSIGGWTYSPSFHPVVVNPQLRQRFVESSVKLLEDYGLDGLDVDYEYPQTDAQATGYVDLLRELREALDRHASSKGANYRFLLTIAAPCGPQNYEKLHIKAMDQYLDFWNLMAYDFAGSWDKISGHQANIFSGDVSASKAVSYYISHGVAPPKVILGVPLYGRSFLNTDGPGKPFSGIGQGSWEAGVYDYRALPLPNSYVMRDEQAKASWTYDYNNREMISFDDEQVAKWKGEWIRKMGLGGSMFWELSGDKGSDRDGMEGGHGKDPQPGESLVKVVKDAMGGLETNQYNWLQYEGSKFDNLKQGMP